MQSGKGGFLSYWGRVSLCGYSDPTDGGGGGPCQLIPHTLTEAPGVGGLLDQISGLTHNLTHCSEGGFGVGGQRANRTEAFQPPENPVARNIHPVGALTSGQPDSASSPRQWTFLCLVWIPPSGERGELETFWKSDSVCCAPGTRTWVGPPSTCFWELTLWREKMHGGEVDRGNGL